MHELALPLLAGLILVALAFDFLNGLHDAANSIATVVATKLLAPVQAVAFAAFFNFAAYFLMIWFPDLHKVADTIGKGLIDKDLVTPSVVFAALVGAMFWNVVTWLKGIPSSSSHALVGGIVGAGVAAAGFGTIQWSGVTKTLLFIPLAPRIGMAVAMIVMLVSSWMARWASARGAERDDALGLAFLDQRNRRDEVSFLVAQLVEPRALLAFDKHPDSAVRQLEQLEHGCHDAEIVQRIAIGIVLSRIELGDQKDRLVGGHGAFERRHRLLAADEQRHDHVRKHDDIAQRQNGQILSHSISDRRTAGVPPSSRYMGR